MSVVKFGTVEFLKKQWKDMFNKRKPGDGLTRLRMKEQAHKIQEKKKKENNSQES